MKNQFLISEDEKNRILSIHETATKKQYLNVITEEAIYNPKTEAIQKKLTELGFNPGTIDGKYGKNTACAVAKFQSNDISLVVDGKVGKNTAAKLGVNPYFPKDVNIKGCGTQQGGNKPQKPSSPINDPDFNQPCESIPPEFCDKISSGSEKSIGQGGSEGCAEFVKKFLGIDVVGDAWQSFIIFSKYGVKYNMYTDGTINWDKIRTDVKSNGINSDSCGCFTQAGGDTDSSCKDGPKISNMISSFYPSSSSVDLNNLKVGDIVGIYWKKSTNKGKAFCNRAVNDRGLGSDGTFKDTSPFTFNTHLGYVGAIKSGVPIIYHSVHGARFATPANQLLNTSGKGMITWVTGSSKSISNNDSTPFDIFNDYKKFLKK